MTKEELRKKYDEVKEKLDKLADKASVEFVKLKEEAEKLWEKIKENARMSNEVPIEVTRKLHNFYSGYEKGEKIMAVRNGERAWLKMQNALAEADIPVEEKAGIERNLERMFPGNYVKQAAEVNSMIDTVLTVKNSMK